MFHLSPLTEPILGEDYINAQFEIELGQDYKKIIMEDFTSLRVHFLEIFPTGNIILNGNRKLRVVPEFTDTTTISFEFQEDYEQRQKESKQKLQKNKFLDCLFPSAETDREDMERLLFRICVSKGFAEFIYVKKNSVKVESQFRIVY